MGFWDFMSNNTIGGASASTANAVVGSVFQGLNTLIQDFKAPPEQVLAFQSKLAELQAQAEAKLEELAVSDRNSARQREMALHDKMPAILAVLFIGGFFGVLAVMMRFGAPAGAGSEAFILILGTLTSGVGLVLGYYFGSSSQSASKTALIGSLAKKD